MRRAGRLFDIIQALRTAKGPTTAAALAERLEVTVRTIYRDVATLQARRVPIEGRILMDRWLASRDERTPGDWYPPTVTLYPNDRNKRRSVP